MTGFAVKPVALAGFLFDGIAVRSCCWGFLGFHQTTLMAMAPMLNCTVSPVTTATDVVN